MRAAAERLVAVRARMLEVDAARQALTGSIGSNGGGYAAGDLQQLNSELASLASSLQECLEELQELGVEVKDLDTGLLDFPSLRNGEEVLLCWRVGEDAVSWWHHSQAGFAGRQPIDWE
ncbi:MAG TPA: DUF2203 domain-containing protein [Gaiellaceae bacterium]